MTATEEWTPQTFVAARRERLARIAAAAKREMPIAAVAEPDPVAPPVEDEPAPTPRPTVPTWYEMMSGRREPTVLSIQAAVAADFEVTLDDIVIHRRALRIDLPRLVAMFLCHTMTRNSSVAIGKRFGDRDHTTVLHAVRRIKRLIQTDADLAARIERIRARLTS